MKTVLKCSLFFALGFSVGCGSDSNPAPVAAKDAPVAAKDAATGSGALAIGDKCSFKANSKSCPATGWCYSSTKEDKCDDGVCTAFSKVGGKCDEGHICDFAVARCKTDTEICVALRKIDESCDATKSEYCDPALGRCDGTSCQVWKAIDDACAAFECEQAKLFCDTDTEKCAKKREVGAACVAAQGTTSSQECLTLTCIDNKCAKAEEFENTCK